MIIEIVRFPSLKCSHFCEKMFYFFQSKNGKLVLRSQKSGTYLLLYPNVHIEWHIKCISMESKNSKSYNHIFYACYFCIELNVKGLKDQVNVLQWRPKSYIKQHMLKKIYKIVAVTSIMSMNCCCLETCIL